MLGTYTKRSTNDVYDTSEGALPFRLQRIAEEDLGETPTRRKESLEMLAKLISEEPELDARRDAEFLLRFLRVRKYNVEAAMQTIRNYYYNRCACDSVYREYLPSAVPPFARKLAMVLPGKDRHGRPVFLCNIGAWNPKEVTQAVFQRACLMCLDFMTSDPSAQTVGMVLIMDCQLFAVENALSFKPGLIKRGIEYLQFKFHGENFESLHEEISPEQLPAQFGGQAPPLDYDTFWSKMDELEDAFEADNRYGYSKKNIGDFATQEEVEEALEFL
ncbi:hypothetical protein HPB49_005644 [Dermacentor silvarum]|uniref:Uncharacterized protein n=1 Tax=Dermacentor silvarum TaxID=543639 RepID=A0ACB8CJG5_DERSI|nr:hypothetical protein HPB49_005644 [Dermacentor silvarum]